MALIADSVLPDGTAVKLCADCKSWERRKTDGWLIEDQRKATNKVAFLVNTRMPLECGGICLRANFLTKWGMALEDGSGRKQDIPAPQ